MITDSMKARAARTRADAQIEDEPKRRFVIGTEPVKPEPVEHQVDVHKTPTSKNKSAARAAIEEMKGVLK